MGHENWTMPHSNELVPSSIAASRRMKAVGQRDTAAEMEIRRRVFAKGFRYRVDYPVLSKPSRRADMVFRRARVAVFIDGCFWHGCPEHGTSSKANAQFWQDKIETNQERDKDTNSRLEATGWKVMRFWEHENPERAAKEIARIVSRRNTSHSEWHTNKGTYEA